MFAVIRTGGKQYLVSPGQKIKIEKIDKPASVETTAGKKEESEIIFDEILLLQKGNKLEIGTPLVKGAKVIGKVLREGKGKKLIVFKYKAKTRYKVKKGHRQPFTEIEITKIDL
jgi:large subunit ribosomal protein L21